MNPSGEHSAGGCSAHSASEDNNCLRLLLRLPICGMQHQNTHDQTVQNAEYYYNPDDPQNDFTGSVLIDRAEKSGNLLVPDYESKQKQTASQSEDIADIDDIDKHRKEKQNCSEQRNTEQHDPQNIAVNAKHISFPHKSVQRRP